MLFIFLCFSFVTASATGGAQCKHELQALCVAVVGACVPSTSIVPVIGSLYISLSQGDVTSPKAVACPKSRFLSSCSCINQAVSVVESGRVTRRSTPYPVPTLHKMLH